MAADVFERLLARARGERSAAPAFEERAHREAGGGEIHEGDIVELRHPASVVFQGRDWLLRRGIVDRFTRIQHDPASRWDEAANVAFVLKGTSPRGAGGHLLQPHCVVHQFRLGELRYVGRAPVELRDRCRGNDDRATLRGELGHFKTPPSHALGFGLGRTRLSRWADEMRRLIARLSVTSDPAMRAILEARAVKLDHMMEQYGKLRR